MNRSRPHLQDFTLFELSEGLLSALKEAEARRHLEECPDCRTRLSEEQGLTVSLRCLELPSPADVSAEVGRSLRARRAEARSRRRWWLTAVFLLVASAAQWLATGLSPARTLTALAHGIAFLPERLSGLAHAITSGALADQFQDLGGGLARMVASSPASIALVTACFLVVTTALAFMFWFAAQRLWLEVRR
jgi:anti-sigma factor RsiW